MERNEAGNEETRDGQGDANDFSATGSTKPSDGFDFTGTAGASDQSQGLKDRARHVIGTAGEKLADVGSSVRERASAAKDRLADALESGAERLRERGQTNATLVGATPDGSTVIQNDGGIAKTSERVAGGMEKTADWLREADIDSVKMSIERQVKEHPGRTLLIAVGLGYLIGRAFRNSQ